MVALRPGAAAYARVAYAREVQGNLAGALQAMEMASPATAATTRKHRRGTGAGRRPASADGTVPEAEREFAAPPSCIPITRSRWSARARPQAASGDREGAFAIFWTSSRRTPTLDLAARIGDLHAEGGKARRPSATLAPAKSSPGPAIAQTEAKLALSSPSPVANCRRR